jgi:tRNA(adenine34) deaminase
MKPKISRADRDWNKYMERALELAREAEARGDVPVGALVVDLDGKIISEGFNSRELVKDPTAHAEILAIKKASEKLEAWRLTGCTLVVTLEPCVMCAGALSMARIDRVVFGAADPRAGATGSIYKMHEDTRLNHRIEVIGGIREEECRLQLVNFFRQKRGKDPLKSATWTGEGGAPDSES